jgi:hypothetical protein
MVSQTQGCKQYKTSDVPLFPGVFGMVGARRHLQHPLSIFVGGRKKRGFTA